MFSLKIVVYHSKNIKRRLSFLLNRLCCIRKHSHSGGIQERPDHVILKNKCINGRQIGSCHYDEIREGVKDASLMLVGMS